MYQVKTVIKSGTPFFEVRRYAANFKSSVLVLETDRYDDAVQVKDYLDARSTSQLPTADPNQLTIDEPSKPQKNGK